MDENLLADALARAERAIDRIEQASAVTRHRENALRDKVRAVVAELDDMLVSQNPEATHG